MVANKCVHLSLENYLHMYHVLNTFLVTKIPSKACFENTLVLITRSSFFNLLLLPLLLMLDVLIHLHLQQLPLHLFLLFLLLQTFQTPVIEPIRNIVVTETYTRCSPNGLTPWPTLQEWVLGASWDDHGLTLGLGGDVGVPGVPLGLQHHIPFKVLPAGDF